MYHFAARDPGEGEWQDPETAQLLLLLFYTTPAMAGVPQDSALVFTFLTQVPFGLSDYEGLMDKCLLSVHPFQLSPFCAMASRDRKGKDRGYFLMLSVLMPGVGCSSCNHQAVFIYPTRVMLATLKSWSSSQAQCDSYAPRDLGVSR